MLTLIRCPHHPVLPQWHVKDPGLSAENADGGLQLDTHTPGVGVGRVCRCLGIVWEPITEENELIHNSSGTQSQSSRLAELL